jgi:putative FmdB family regulatory protein
MVLHARAAGRYPAAMPLYEYRCPRCGRIEEVFARSMNTAVKAPRCHCEGAPKRGAEMQRTVSPFARHRTLKDQMQEAEARFGKEVDAAMGPSPDVGKYAKRYDELAKDLPPE